MTANDAHQRRADALDVNIDLCTTHVRCLRLLYACDEAAICVRRHAAVSEPLYPEGHPLRRYACHSLLPRSVYLDGKSLRQRSTATGEAAASTTDINSAGKPTTGLWLTDTVGYPNKAATPQTKTNALKSIAARTIVAPV